MTKSSKFVVGLMAGTVVGAIAGLILAPKPGREARAIVGSRASQFKDRAEIYVDNLKERFKKEPEVAGFEERSENGVHS